MKDYICHENGCNKAYTNPYNLKRHLVLKHYRTKQFKCPLCEKELSSMQNLKEHESMHKGDKTYKCSLCAVQFRYCSQLSKHRKIHKKHQNVSEFVELKVINKQLTDLMKVTGFSLELASELEESIGSDEKLFS